jgi:uncharacterized surface anchored protein
MLRRVILLLIVLSLVFLISSVAADTGCMLVHKTVAAHDYPVSTGFYIDLRNSDGVVVKTLYFDDTGTQTVHGLPIGDYTVIEQDPGSLWTISGDNNKKVTVAAGESVCSIAAIKNEYNRGCIQVHKTVDAHDYPVSGFYIDLRNSDGVVVKTLYFDKTGTQTVHGLPIGDYTVVEQDPGSLWTITGDNNKEVTVAAGESGCSNAAIKNEYNRGCIQVHKTIVVYDYPGAMDFFIDIRNPDGFVMKTLHFDHTGTQTVHGLPVGDYTVVEQDPGSLWTVSGDNNKEVTVAAGESVCSIAGVKNEYNKCGGLVLQVTGNCGVIQLSWTDTGADHYDVYRGTTSGGPYVMIGSVTTNSYNDNSAASGTTYYYVVQSADKTGSELCQSNEGSAGSASCIPEFPSDFLPATLVIGFLGTVLFIRRTREH